VTPKALKNCHGRHRPDHQAGARKAWGGRLLSGVLVHGPDGLTTGCRGKDMSAGGAQLELNGPALFRSPTGLLISKLDRGWEVTVEWQRAAGLGVKLLREIDLAGRATAEPDRTLQRLWQGRQ